MTPLGRPSTALDATAPHMRQSPLQSPITVPRDDDQNQRGLDAVDRAAASRAWLACRWVMKSTTVVALFGVKARGDVLPVTGRPTPSSAAEVWRLWRRRRRERRYLLDSDPRIQLELIAQGHDLEGQLRQWTDVHRQPARGSRNSQMNEQRKLAPCPYVGMRRRGDR